MGIRVLHVLHAYRAGGMENMIAQMAWRLGKQGFTIGVCALTCANQFKSRLPLGVRVFELNRAPGVDIKCIFNLRRLFKEFKPDVVHSHNWNALVYSVVALAGLSVPLLHGEHAKLYEWERSFLRIKLRHLLYRRCRLVHTVCLAQLKELSQFGISDRLKAISNGVDAAQFAPGSKIDCRKLIKVPPEAVCIGVVARFVPEKRHRLVLEAFETLGTLYPNLFLVLVGAGGGGEKDVMTMVETHPVRNRIRCLGHRNDMVNVYRAMDLLLVASDAEGMSNVCLEAMSCGVPALVNKASGTDELIQDGITGFVADMNCSATIVDSIVNLLATPALLESVGLNARVKIERDYQLDVTEQSYSCVYKQLADGGQENL